MTPGERKLLIDLERGPMRSSGGRPFARLFEAGFIARVVANIYRINHAGAERLARARAPMVPVELVVRETRACASCTAPFFPYRDHHRCCSRRCRRLDRIARSLQVPIPGVLLAPTPAPRARRKGGVVLL